MTRTSSTQGSTASTSSLPAPARTKGRRGEAVTKALFVVPAVLTLAALFGYPVVKNVLMSFQDYSLATFFTGRAPFVGLANYRAVFDDPLFGKAVANTVLFTVACIAAQFAIGMLLALFFRRSFPLNGVIRALFLLPWLIPLIVGSATWRAILEQDSGVLNVTLEKLHIIGAPVPWLTSPKVALISVILVNVWLGIPFNLTLLYSGLQDIPEDLYEAAALDGASPWKAFWNVTWPSLRSVVLVTLTLGVVYTLKVLDIILGLTGGGPANATATLALQSYQRSFVDFRFGQGAALSNILIVVSLVFAVGYLRLARRRIDE